MFTVFSETTQMGEFMCDMWFWRGVPPCLKESFVHGGYSFYPTREKAKIIVDSWHYDGLYPKEVLISYFGSLASGNYQPVPSVSPGTYWDSAYFALVKLDYRIPAKRMLMDIVMDDGWAKGKFKDERYKALQVLAKERIITLKQYAPLKQFLADELQKPEPNYSWVNTLVISLSSFREWGDELLPLFREAYLKAPEGQNQIVLQSFLDFDIPDDSEVILSKYTAGNLTSFDDKKMAIRAAYILDDELTVAFLKDELKKEELSEELTLYMKNSLTRLAWFGNWEITDTEETWDAGLEKEKIAFKMKRSLDEKDDIVNFTMIMQLNDPIELKPIGMDDTFESNNVSFIVTEEELIFKVYNPYARITEEKKFILKEGTGRNEGKVYMKFPIEGATDRRGKQKYGFVEIEKIS